MSDEADTIQGPAVDRVEAKRVLLEQAKALDIEIDGRWSVERLAEAVMEAQSANASKAASAIEQASDTWVYLLRDAFPITDMKRKAGDTIRIPADMAERWYEAGVARPGKPKA